MFKKAMKFIRFILIVIVIAVSVFIWNVFNYTEVDYSSPVWSPDGKKIYYLKNITYNKNDLAPFFRLYVHETKSYVMSMNPDGSWKKAIVKYEGVFDKKPYLTTLYNLAITPDGRDLLFYRANDLREGGAGIYRVNIKDKKIVKLVADDEEFHCYNFYISPDGRTIAYTRNYNNKDPNIDHRTVWLIDFDGRNDHMICNEDSYVLGWTVGGDIIIRIFDESKENWQLWEYNVSSKNFVKKVPSGFYSSEVEVAMKSLNAIKKTNISPDGKKEIFYFKNYTGTRGINGKHQRYLLKDIKRP